MRVFRKRYTVVVVGLRGSSAAQRSEISRHRRERDALAAGAEERDRLTISQGAHAANYQVVVERDGVAVETLDPVPPQDPAAGAGRAEPGDAHTDLFGDEVAGLEDILDPGTRPAADADAAPALEPEADAPDPGVETRAPRLPSWDEIPVGPVPEDVLEYFESAVAREERRRAGRRDDAGTADGPAPGPVDRP